MDFAEALRGRRTRRKLSQLELAVRAGTTQRHLSFLESGRSTPGRAMVIRLTESLDLPLRDRNDLLLAAGFAPAYPETPLDHDGLRPVHAALDHILAGHLPYPAIIVDRRGELIGANTAFDLLTEGAAEELLRPPVNVYRLALSPHGLAPRIINLDQWARHILNRLDQEHLTELHAELSGYVRPAVVPTGHLGFAAPLHLRTRRGELRLLTTVTTFATALDVTLAELKLEAFLPADAATARALTGEHGTPASVGA